MHYVAFQLTDSQASGSTVVAWNVSAVQTVVDGAAADGELQKVTLIKNDDLSGVFM